MDELLKTFEFALKLFEIAQSNWSINSLERSVISKFSVSDSSISYGISEQDVYIISSPSSGKNVVIFMYNEKVDPATCS